MTDQNKEEQRADDLILLLVQRIVSDKPLGYVDSQWLERYLNLHMFEVQLTVEKMEARIKRFKQAIPNFLEQVELALENTQKRHAKFRKEMMQHMEWVKNLPPGVKDHDHQDVIALAKQLTKEYYSFSDAAKFLKTSRQTLAQFAEKQEHNLRKHYPLGSTPKLSRQDMIDYYRERFHKDYDFFDALMNNSAPGWGKGRKTKENGR
ncbi:MAG: hypothetical protein EOO08_13080 [Chitinophagaceae bacterium]|nr:MAG: hypothetical protein EOO08_13080 [Chitinophagaceae bacterium]